MKNKLVSIILIIVLLSITIYYAIKYKQTIELNKKSVSKEKFQDLFPNKFSEAYRLKQKRAPQPFSTENIDPEILPKPQEKISP